jgi:hypothetical protein
MAILCFSRKIPRLNIYILHMFCNAGTKYGEGVLAPRWRSGRPMFGVRSTGLPAADSES